MLPCVGIRALLWSLPAVSCLLARSRPLLLRTRRDRRGGTVKHRGRGYRGAHLVPKLVPDLRACASFKAPCRIKALYGHRPDMNKALFFQKLCIDMVIH